MAGWTSSVFIAAPREVVWGWATDLERWPETIGAITKIENLTGGAMGVGTRFRETRVMFGREVTEEMEVVAFEPPRRYALSAESHGNQYRTEALFEAEGDGTRQSFVFEARARTAMAKVLSVVMAPMMKKMLLKCIAEDQADLKRACEGGGVERA